MALQKRNIVSLLAIRVFIMGIKVKVYNVLRNLKKNTNIWNISKVCLVTKRVPRQKKYVAIY